MIRDPWGGAGRRWLGLVLLTLLGGCVTGFHERSASQQAMVTDTPAIAYQKATRAVLAMGDQVVSHDPGQRTVSARLNKAVVLNVTLTPHGQGTQLVAQATAEPGMILARDVPDETQRFFTAYHQQ